MKSNNEEYLDSLLNSAKSNNDNPQSALSRMASKGKGDTSAFIRDDNAEDIGALVDNANGNKDLQEIGDILERLDKDELVDDKMASLLDDIAKPTSSEIPTFTVGNAPSAEDVRDPEEIALDEAIADAERMDAEIQSGKFADTTENVQEKPPIIDETEDDNSLLEMAPEMIVPEDNAVEIDKENDSDADQTPEEILTDLLDDDPGNSLMEQESNDEESLSDLLDNIQDDDASNSDGDNDESASDDIDIDNLDIDNLSLDDLEAAMDKTLSDGMSEENDLSEDSSGNTQDESSEENVEEDISLDELSLDDLDPEKAFEMEETSQVEAVSEDAETGELVPDNSSDTSDEDGSTDDELKEDKGEASSESGDKALDDLSEDFNLNDLEASLDDLLGDDANQEDSTAGEVASIGSDEPEGESTSNENEQEDISLDDLDALMNSLANDEVEDIENTAHLEEEQDIPKGEILDALTEDMEEGEEPSLDDLASIPEKGDKDDDELEDDSESEDKKVKKGKKGKKDKKEKKEGFFARLFKALTEEDEENTEGLASLTDENQQVLNELGEEGAKPKKEKKKKEKKPKKEKPKKEPKPKKEKPPKPKKEKKPKPPKDPEAPERAMSPKKIAVSFIFAASLGILFCIPAIVLPEQISNTRAVNAYNQREYTTAYKLLYGKDKTEEQNYIYEQSRVLAWAQRYLSGYQNYTAMNMNEEALDMLLMAMRNKDSLLEEAANYGVENQVQSVYDSIESLLSESYGLSSEDIEEINSIKKERDYTIRLMEIVGTLES